MRPFGGVFQRGENKMKNLSSLIKADTVIKVEHPEYDGFIVEVGFVSKEKTRKMIEKATIKKFSKSTHQLEEDVDNDIFLKMYTKALVRGWEGLKMEYLMELAPVDLGDSDLETTVDFDDENALILMQNSNAFDQWLSGVSGDIKNFSTSNLKKKKD